MDDFICIDYISCYSSLVGSYTQLSENSISIYGVLTSYKSVIPVSCKHQLFYGKF